MAADQGLTPSDTEPPAPRTKSARPPVRIAILGLFGSPNHGNEATLAAFVQNVSRRVPGVEFVGIAPRQSNIADSMGYRHLLLDPLPVAQYFWRLEPTGLRDACIRMALRATEGRRRRVASALLEGISALVMPGTGLIDDFGQRPLDLPTHIDRWTRAAALRGIPSSFLSVGASTVRSKTSRALFRLALARAEYCSFRDDVSVDNARALGHGGEAPMVPDLAFSLPPEWLVLPARRSPRRVVGIGVMGYVGWNRSAAEGERIYRRYLDKVCTLVDCVLADGHEVRLLTGDARADDDTVRDVLGRCTPGAAASGRLHADPIVTFRDVLTQLGACDVVAATRFHNVLLSLLLERPTISIGYGDKNDAVMAYFDLQRFGHDIETFDVAVVRQQIRDLERRPQDALAVVPQRLADARARLDLQFDRWCARWSAT